MLLVILLSMLMILLFTVYASDLWQQLELASEIESDLWYTVDWDRKWLIDFNNEKPQLALFDRITNTGAIDVKVDRSVLEEK